MAVVVVVGLLLTTSLVQMVVQAQYGHKHLITQLLVLVVAGVEK